MKNLLLIELNEFNFDLLSAVADRLDLKNIQRMLGLPRSVTRSPEQIEHHGLDPWVQWVSIHTGVPAREHQVYRVGDIDSLEHSPIWATLGEMNVSSGAWGAMSAKNGDAKKCLFFVPDPWFSSEKAKPSHLDDFLSLPQYYGKQYSNIRIKNMFNAMMHLARFFLTEGIPFSLLRRTHNILMSIVRYGLPSYLLFCLFDYISTHYFIRFCLREKPGFGLLFLNHIAHMQHHVWHHEDGASPDIEHGIKWLDSMLGDLYLHLHDSYSFVFVNGLSQKYLAKDAVERSLYRQKNIEKFLLEFGIEGCVIEPGMTNDAYALFKNTQQRDSARQVLEAVTVSGERLLDVVASSKDDLKLFYQIRVYREVQPSEVITSDDISIPFYKLIYKVNDWTGVHVSHGDVLTDALSIPPELWNHEIKKYLVKYYTERSDFQI